MSTRVAGWAKTAGDSWLCSWPGVLGTDSCALALWPGSPENQPDCWHLPGSSWPPTELERQALHDQGPAPHLQHTLALRTAQHILLHLQAFAHTVLSAWNVLWLPTPGSGDQELEKLRSNPARFISRPPSRLPSTLHVPDPGTLARAPLWCFPWGFLGL